MFVFCFILIPYQFTLTGPFWSSGSPTEIIRAILDQQEFCRCCRVLLGRSEQLGDGWSWEAVQDSEEGYLRKTYLRTVPATHRHKLQQSGSEPQLDSDPSRPAAPGQGQDQSVSDITDDVTSEITDEDDGACLVAEGSGQVLQIEYHVLFSCSYRTPVLFFRATTLEGRGLTMEEVWHSVHPNFKRHLQSSPLSAITQQEHPFLGQPFFYLHPCRTEDFMRPLLQTAQDEDRPVNYVLAWLSAVGPAVGLDVPLQYFLSNTDPP